MEYMCWGKTQSTAHSCNYKWNWKSDLGILDFLHCEGVQQESAAKLLPAFPVKGEKQILNMVNWSAAAT